MQTKQNQTNYKQNKIMHKQNIWIQINSAGTKIK